MLALKKGIGNIWPGDVVFFSFLCMRHGRLCFFFYFFTCIGKHEKKPNPLLHAFYCGKLIENRLNFSLNMRQKLPKMNTRNNYASLYRLTVCMTTAPGTLHMGC
jgi:hypothetical protein